MIRTGLLLAAGASRRFGPADKLLALVYGRPLVQHAADAMRRAPLDHRIAVIANPALRPLLTGFRIVEIISKEQSDSLRAGLAEAGQPDRLVIALGDMPDVTPDLLAQVLDRTTHESPAASHDGQRPMPPACFPRAWLPRLATSCGDRGAAGLLRDLPERRLVHAPALLRDVDLPNQIV
ncbi:nucleotidyltransferase family protein [Paracoccus beibuensis]|uniref:nucleotidyltransferase family protein n=1 Tax=Paracoccus beibuensis TaxID=547602 RepID=UPI0022402DFE|nr:nucleotidyltransferase family protein [Paracoccus beibuensis]